MCDTGVIYYREEQRFRQLWIWLLILMSPAFLIGVLLQQIILGHSYDFGWVILAIILALGPLLLIYNTGLDTEVRDSGVCIRFRPFHRKWRVFRFDSIREAEACTYSALKDYGGWGIRYGFNGKAYNVSGNKGVMLILSDQKSVMIGSRNHDTFCSAINQRLLAHRSS